MAILPRFVMLVIIAHLDAVLLWFSDLIYAELLKHADDHLLVKLQAHLDVTPLEQACAAFHHASGPGAPITHPVPRLVRAFLVKYLFGWSLRDLELQVRFNLVAIRQLIVAFYTTADRSTFVP